MEDLFLKLTVLFIKAYLGEGRGRKSRGTTYFAKSIIGTPRIGAKPKIQYKSLFKHFLAKFCTKV